MKLPGMIISEARVAVLRWWSVFVERSGASEVILLELHNLLLPLFNQTVASRTDPEVGGVGNKVDLEIA
jgi:hypothetical protein